MSWRITPGMVTTLATGGDIITNSFINGQMYRIHTFTTVGTSTLTVVRGGSFECLVVAGGGSGGRGETAVAWGGGGGGGGFLEGNMSLAAGTFSILVGAGGILPTSNLVSGNSGQNSSFNSAIALGGGGGGGFNLPGSNGGSGGGVGGVTATLAGSATQGNSGGLTGYGNAGGSRTISSAFSGGGGGAGSIGGTATISSGGAGGTGRISLLTNLTYAAGGSLATGNGAANTGNGGGGIVDSGNGNGGSGIVIVRYAIA